MKRFISSVAVVLFAAITTASLAADQSNGGTSPTSPAKASKSKVVKSASEKYFGRVQTYLKPVASTMTPDETAAVKALEDKSAPVIDGDDPIASKKAKSSLHAAVIAAMTADQQVTLKSAHARKSKGSKTSNATAGNTASTASKATKGGDSSDE